MSAPSTPAEGLPENLPRGERILWRGRPDALALALAAFRAGWVAAYFAGLFAWRLVSALADGAGAVDALFSATSILMPAALGLALLMLLAWLAARTTIYTITDRRVVMRIGIALPLTLNLPYAQIESAWVKTRRGGAGDIAFGLRPGARVGFLVLWPHARAWHFARPQPALRAIPDVAVVADRVARALSGGEPARRPEAPTRSEPMPMPAAWPAAAE